jgi:DNA (cytosine-5)-methyltransferase 1
MVLDNKKESEQLVLDCENNVSVVPKIKRNENNSHNLKFIDLFAGIGGFHHAFHNQGAECVFASEIDEQARITYQHNFQKISPNLFETNPLNNENLFNKNITEINPQNIPDHDILCGGFPCQAFSIAGYRKGFNDKGRGDLIFNILEIIKIKQPRVIFLENVKNLYHHDKGQTYRYIKDLIEKQGYFVKEKVLNTMLYGNLPQNRERLYIVGFKNKEECWQFDFPRPQKLIKNLNDILEKDEVDDYYYYKDKPLFEKIKNDIIKENTVYQWRRVYTRENKSGVCPTLTANMGTGGHNVPIIKDKKGIRKLMPMECVRLQGFPDSFTFPKSVNKSHQYKQAGNSVSVSVIEAIAQKILQVIL